MNKPLYTVILFQEDDSNLSRADGIPCDTFHVILPAALVVPFYLQLENQKAIQCRSRVENWAVTVWVNPKYSSMRTVQYLYAIAALVHFHETNNDHPAQEEIERFFDKETNFDEFNLNKEETVQYLMAIQKLLD